MLQRVAFISVSILCVTLFSADDPAPEVTAPTVENVSDEEDFVLKESNDNEKEIPKGEPKTLFSWDNPLGAGLDKLNLPPACADCHAQHSKGQLQRKMVAALDEMLEEVNFTQSRAIASTRVSNPLEGGSAYNCALCVWGDDESMWQHCDAPDRRKSRSACEAGWETAETKRCVWKPSGRRCIAETKDLCYRYASNVAPLYRANLIKMISKTSFLSPILARATFQRLKENGCMGQITLTLMERKSSPNELMHYLGMLSAGARENPRLYIDSWACSVHEDLEKALDVYGRAPNAKVARLLEGKTAYISANQVHSFGAPGRFDVWSAAQTRAIFQINAQNEGVLKAHLKHTTWCRDKLDADDMPRWCVATSLNRSISCRSGFEKRREAQGRNVCCPRPMDEFTAELPSSLRYVYNAGESCPAANSKATPTTVIE